MRKTSPLHLLPCLLLALASGALASERPGCLAGICLDETAATVTARLGRGVLSPHFGHCYRSGETYLAIAMDDDQTPPQVGSILIASRPICAEHGPLDRKLPVTETCRGVKLDDSLASVLEKHGPASPRPKDERYPWSDAAEDIDDYTFTCTAAACTEQLSIYIRDQRVVGIATWLPDC